MGLDFRAVHPAYTFGMLAVGAFALTATFFQPEIKSMLTPKPDHSIATPTQVKIKLLEMPTSHRPCMIDGIERSEGAVSRYQLDSIAQSCRQIVSSPADAKTEQLNAAKSTLQLNWP